MTILFLGLVFLAALAGTLTGFGTSMILVSILSLFYPLPEVLLFVGVIHWFGDVWKVALFRSGVKWHIVPWFAVPGAILSVVGAQLVLSLPQEWLLRALGLVIIGWGVFSLSRPKWRVPPSRLNSAVGGTLSGFLAGLLGVGGAVRGAFLHAFGLRKELYLFTSGLTALAIDSSRLGAYYLGGVRLDIFSPTLLALAVVVSLLAALLARYLVSRLPTQQFRRVVAIGLILVGIGLIFP